MKVKCIENNSDNSNYTVGKEYLIINNRLTANFAGLSDDKIEVKDVFEYGLCKFQLMI